MTTTDQTKQSSETLSFYTLGPDFTNLMHSFLEEGNFSKVHAILTESNDLPDDIIKDFFKFKYEFVGDTRDDTFALSKVKNPNSDKQFYAMIKMAFAQAEWSLMDLDDELLEYDEVSEDIKTLLKIFKADEIISIIKWEWINEDYVVYPKVEDVDVEFENGVLLTDGTYVACSYQEHMELYRLLWKCNLVDAGCWTDEETALHISSGEASGHIAHRYTEASKMLKEALYKIRHKIKNYGEYDTLMYSIFEDYKRLDKGGKYTGLLFLKDFYKWINTPQTYVSYPFENKNRFCLRTSPRYSMPGLLNSIFDPKCGESGSVFDMKQEFERLCADPKFESLTKYNKLTVFYQDYIEGINGVASVSIEGDFDYGVSDERGKIVGGHFSNVGLSDKNKYELRSICKELYDDFEQELQLEFVVDKEDKLWIVQFRLLENSYEKNKLRMVKPPKKYLFKGKTFSKGTIECNIEDVLIVDEDASSEELIGKKALIVTNEMQFSHILALSKMLKIPSVYATGPVDFKNKKKLKIIAHNKEAYICG